MKKLKTICSFLCFYASVAVPLVAKPQSDSAFQFIKTIKGDFTYLNVDNLDNIYLVTNSTQLKKFYSNGDSVVFFFFVFFTGCFSFPPAFESAS